MSHDNINDYMPSLLNPRGIRKQHDLSLTQNSIASRVSLSLKRPNGQAKLSTVKPVNQTNNGILRQTQDIVQKTQIAVKTSAPKDLTKSNNKENCLNRQNIFQETQNVTKDLTEAVLDDINLGLSFLEDFVASKNDTQHNTCNVEFDIPQIEIINDRYTRKDAYHSTKAKFKDFYSLVASNSDNTVNLNELPNIITDRSWISHSSATSLDNVEIHNASTDIYSIDARERPTVKVCFGVNGCESVDVTSKSSVIKRFLISRNEKSTEIDCEVIENSQISTETEVDENMNETPISPQKRPAVSVNLEIKKQKLTHNDSAENSKVLILKTNAIEKISHVIVQPPNYKFVKRILTHKSKYKKDKSGVRNGNSAGVRLKQVAIECFLRPATDAKVRDCKLLRTVSIDDDVSKEMSKNLGVIDAAKCDRLKSAKERRDLMVPRKELNESPKSARLPSKRDLTSPRRPDVKTSNSDAPSPRSRNESISAHSPRKNVESTHFSLPIKSKSNKTSLSPKNIPHHKIVAGTHFAVDAFSYGEIPNVKHYFLTHFHSDHYSGLKKSFNKLLFCSKITADLCISRLGVNPKNIRIVNIDEVLRIEGVEVAAVDANHCPGALMLIFTLPNGKTLLHTGDFRACPAMESYPVFWNKDIHTVYLDTTYCSPRYDFPTQDQSLEMALYILRQKKMALEKAGKKFSSVLIVCGTYTIGKEKFFLGMSRRVGCAVWACPEKERVLQTVEGRACSRDPPDSCQLHVVPMRDLTHEKLRSYLDSLHGAFAEVVAFKPSGWENGKNSSVEKDLVTIHGIPYSEHSSFSELIRFVKFLKPKQVVPTVDISGGVKAVQKYFPCPLVYKDEFPCQTKVTDYFSIHSRQQVPAVT